MQSRLQKFVEVECNKLYPSYIVECVRAPEHVERKVYDYGEVINRDVTTSFTVIMARTDGRAYLKKVLRVEVTLHGSPLSWVDLMPFESQRGTSQYVEETTLTKC